MNHILIKIGFTIGALLILSSCDDRCEISNHTFELPCTIEPKSASFEIGDTISVSFNFSNLIYDRSTNASYELIEFNFYPNFGMTRIDSIIRSVNSSDFSGFEVILDQNQNISLITLSGEDTYLNGQFVYNNDRYSLDYLLVCKERGTYMIRNTMLLYDFGKAQDFANKCNNVDLEAAVVVNSSGDNNIDLLNESPESHYNTNILGNPKVKYHDVGGFAFKVE